MVSGGGYRGGFWILDFGFWTCPPEHSSDFGLLVCGQAGFGFWILDLGFGIWDLGFGTCPPEHSSDFGLLVCGQAGLRFGIWDFGFGFLWYTMKTGIRDYEPV